MQDSKRDTDVWNSLLNSVGEGEGGMIWENGIETCIISYKKRTDSPSSMHDTGCSGLVHWDDPEGWDVFAGNVPLVSLIFLKRSLVFPILLFSSISLH